MANLWISCAKQCLLVYEKKLNKVVDKINILFNMCKKPLFHKLFLAFSQLFPHNFHLCNIGLFSTFPPTLLQQLLIN